MVQWRSRAAGAHTLEPQHNYCRRPCPAYQQVETFMVYPQPNCWADWLLQLNHLFSVEEMGKVQSLGWAWELSGVQCDAG